MHWNDASGESVAHNHKSRPTYRRVIIFLGEIIFLVICTVHVPPAPWIKSNFNVNISPYVFQIPFGLIRMTIVVVPFLYVGTLISKNFAALLEEHDIFVPEDDDDDDWANFREYMVKSKCTLAAPYLTFKHGCLDLFMHLIHVQRVCQLHVRECSVWHDCDDDEW